MIVVFTFLSSALIVASFPTGLEGFGTDMNLTIVREIFAPD